MEPSAAAEEAEASTFVVVPPRVRSDAMGARPVAAGGGGAPEHWRPPFGTGAQPSAVLSTFDVAVALGPATLDVAVALGPSAASRALAEPEHRRSRLCSPGATAGRSYEGGSEVLSDASRHQMARAARGAPHRCAPCRRFRARAAALIPAVHLPPFPQVTATRTLSLRAATAAEAARWVEGLKQRTVGGAAAQARVQTTTRRPPRPRKPPPPPHARLVAPEGPGRACAPPEHRLRRVEARCGPHSPPPPAPKSRRFRFPLGEAGGRRSSELA